MEDAKERFFYKAMPSLLFQLCTARRWDDAAKLIRSKPDEAGKLLDTGKRGAAPISALHVVLAHAKCRGDVPLSLVKALIAAAPEMAGQKHLYTGNLPLHAVFYNAFFSASKRKQIAEMILEAHPISLTARNHDGRTPLHTNCSQHCNHEPIVALLEKAPETARWSDNNGDYPIHLACKSQKSPNKSIQALFDAYPQGVLKKNKEGLTPLQVTMQCHFPGQKRRARVALLVKLQKQVADYGDSPKDEAVENGYYTRSTRSKRKRDEVSDEFPSYDLSEDDAEPPTKRWRYNTLEPVPALLDEAMDTETRQDSHENNLSCEDARVDAEPMNVDTVDMGQEKDETPGTFVPVTPDPETWSGSVILVAMKNGGFADEKDLELPTQAFSCANECSNSSSWIQR